MGMADGYAQATGRPTLVNLHTAPGVGNAMGAIFNAQANKSPLVVTAGQQARSLMTLQANLTNRDATAHAAPAREVELRAAARARTCRTRSRARRTSRRCRRAGPVVRLDPDGRLGRRGRRRVRRATRSRRRVGGRARRRPGGGRGAGRGGSRRRANPVLVAGPDIDASGGWDAAVALAERQRLPVWATPGAGRRAARLPRGPPALPGHPAAGDRPARGDARRATTWSSSPARRCSPTTRTSPARCCPRAPRSSRSRATPTRRRARRWATRSSPTSALTLEALLEAGRRVGPRRAAGAARRPSRRADADPMQPGRGVRALAEVFPEDGIVVLESPSSHARAAQPAAALAARAATTSAPAAGSASGCAAAVGVQLAQPERPVVCVLGEGSAQYAITALWTRRRLRGAGHRSWCCATSEYAILKWFAELEDVEGAPGLDLPALDSAAVAARLRRARRARRRPEELGDGAARRDRVRASRGSSRSRWRPGWRWTKSYLTRRIRGWPSGARTCGSSSSACSSCHGL